MYTLAIVKDNINSPERIKNFGTSATVQATLDDNYEFVEDLGRHKLYKFKPNNTYVVYKQYDKSMYLTLVKLQAAFFRNKLLGVTPQLYIVSYNCDLHVVETIEEYIAGKPIGHYFDYECTLDIDDLNSIAMNISMFLGILDSYGLIHRDIKVDNIILTDKYQLAYVVDFDSVVYQNDLPYTKAIGTAGYASPEHFIPDQLSIKSDVYSLGMVLHQLMTIHHVADDEDQDLVDMLETLIAKMILIDPNMRPTPNQIEDLTT